MAALQALDAALPGEVRAMNATATLLFGIAAALLFGAMLLWLSRQPIFNLRAIQVEGDVARNGAASIRAHAAPQLVGNFFTLDLDAGRQAFESVPWVRQAVLSRVWPNRLVVRLEEHRAVALWGQDGERLVNSHGEVFDADFGDLDVDALPTLVGPEESSAALLSMLLRLAPVMQGMNARIETLALSGRGSWRAELDSGAVIELGRGSEDEVVERARRFVVTAQPLIGRYGAPLESADLRHNQAYALRLRGISTTSAPASAPAPRK